MTSIDALADGNLLADGEQHLHLPADDTLCYSLDQFHNSQWPAVIPFSSFNSSGAGNFHGRETLCLPQATGLPNEELQLWESRFPSSACTSKTSNSSSGQPSASPTAHESRPIAKHPPSDQPQPRNAKRKAPPEHPPISRRRNSSSKPSNQERVRNDKAGHGNNRDAHKRIQERNRLAANRFRVRKREDAERLKEEEWEVEQQHRALSVDVEVLTTEVYQLKMQLLRHSDCNCSLIQDYIRTEAQKYINYLDSHPPK